MRCQAEEGGQGVPPRWCVMTRYRFPDVLGGGEHEGTREGETVGFNLPGLVGYLWLHMTDVTEVPPPIPAEPGPGAYHIGTLHPAANDIPALLARLAEVEGERDEARFALGQENHARRINEASLLAQLAEARALAAVCTCIPWPPEGPSPECAVHGAIQALNEAEAENARLRRSVESWTETARVYATNADDWRTKADTMRPVVEAAKAYRAVHPVGSGYAKFREAQRAFFAAVDLAQTPTEYRDPDAHYPADSGTMVCNRCGGDVWTGDDGWACGCDSAMFEHAKPTAVDALQEAPETAPSSTQSDFQPSDVREATDGVGEQGEALGALREANDRADVAIAALAALVDLKDGPRDDRYRSRKEAAWDRARWVVNGFGEQIPGSSIHSEGGSGHEDIDDLRLPSLGKVVRTGRVTWAEAAEVAMDGLLEQEKARADLADREARSDYVCPQCGPDPAGSMRHAETHHTWHGGESYDLPISAVATYANSPMPPDVKAGSTMSLQRSEPPADPPWLEEAIEALLADDKGGPSWCFECAHDKRDAAAAAARIAVRAALPLIAQGVLGEAADEIAGLSRESDVPAAHAMAYDHAAFRLRERAARQVTG